MEHGANPDAPAWAVAVEASALAFAIRDSTWIYPAANVGHILGLALVVGPIILLDLRLLGLMRAVDVEALSRLATPLVVAGLVVSIVSGAALFAADAGAMAANPAFWVKIGLVAAVVLNALLFRLLWHRAIPAWDAAPPLLGRLQAAASVALWLCAASAGRLIAYF